MKTCVSHFINKPKHMQCATTPHGTDSSQIECDIPKFNACIFPHHFFMQTKCSLACERHSLHSAIILDYCGERDFHLSLKMLFSFDLSRKPCQALFLMIYHFIRYECKTGHISWSCLSLKHPILASISVRWSHI